MRSRKAYLADMTGDAHPSDHIAQVSVRGAFGIRQDSDDWLALQACRPMAALVSIHGDDDDFVAPVDSAFGAGDLVKAERLACACFAPRHPRLEPLRADELAYMRRSAVEAFSEGLEPVAALPWREHPTKARIDALRDALERGECMAVAA